MLKSHQISVLYETLSFMTMKVIIFYEKKFIKKNFLIRQDVSSLRQSYQLSDLSQNDYFVIRLYIYIYIYISIYLSIYLYDFKQSILYLTTL